ncbi:hypothetical protein CGC21_28985 [Leishmania donovani]|uniref:Uncharacterized protein n=1 Tax=Leishmania donovani TaxID=5661 RepID=A0A504XLT9_LEIDO|nr:hypothetical protein CGC21_28985 [Leishmania donovani]
MDDEVTRESRGVVILGATPNGYSDASAGMQNMGYLTVCHSPSHKLSYEDTQKLQKMPEPQDATQQVLMHITGQMKIDGTARLLYSVYEVGVQPLMPLRVEFEGPDQNELEALAREKADLAKRILELNRKLLSSGTSEMSGM